MSDPPGLNMFRALELLKGHYTHALYGSRSKGPVALVLVYTATQDLHVHYWANGAQVGTYAYGDLTYLDTPVMWKWIV